MLNLRSALVLTAAALCLWSLFELLSHLNEPGLLRSEKATVIKGCDDVSSEETRKVCAPLFCQKALIERREVPWNARFTLSQRASSADKAVEIVTGSTDASHRFACVVRQQQVVAAQVGSEPELAALIEQADTDVSALLEERS